MATHTLNNSINVGITLTTGGNDRSPFTVTTHGTINTTGNFGVYSTISSASLLNEGFITAYAYGVLFNDGGSVDNRGTIVGKDEVGVCLFKSGVVLNDSVQALISGGDYGVSIRNGIGTVVNDGTIIGTSESGIYLEQGGNVTNSSISATILGGGYGVRFGDVGSVTNDGTIGGGDAGVLLEGGEVTNIGTVSQIYGDTGVYVRGNSGAVTNDGTIKGKSSAIFMREGGIVVNRGSISGGYAGITGYDAAETITNYGDIFGGTLGLKLNSGGTVTNSGTITGQFKNGVELRAGGTVVNYGSIYGRIYGVYLRYGSVVNYGTIFGRLDAGIGAYNSFVDITNHGSIYGRYYGVQFRNNQESITNLGTIFGAHGGIRLPSGNVYNSGSIYGNAVGITVGYGSVVNTGTISGGNGGNGIYLYEGGTVTNSGTIFGGSEAVLFSGKASADDVNNRLIVDPGAVFEGQVLASSNASATNTLELAAGRAATLAGVIGQDFVGFTTFAFDPGASWSVTADVAALTEGELITGFAPGDTIDLADVAFTRTGGAYGAAGEDTYTVATAGTLTLDADGSIYKFDITGAAVGQHDFVLGGDDLTITEVACYVTGTRIATSVGEVPVEDLIIGDLVETRDAGLRPVKWIGRRRYDGRFIKGNKDALPVCIKQGALGKNVPARDLWVSPGHAVCVDGALVHAFRLVNGVSVVQAEAVESVAYYHVELDSHEVMFAENCPAESFFDEDFRGQFQNAAEYEALYPGRSLAGRRCLPRLEDGFALEALRQRVNAQAGIAVPVGHGRLRGFVDEAGPDVCTGWAQDVLHPELPVSLDVFVGGVAVARVLANGYRADLRDAGLGSGCHGFRAVLSAGLRGVVEVRRAVDGAALPLTVAARALAA